MSHVEEELSQRIKTLEKELSQALDDKGKAFSYTWVNGKAKFEQAMLAHHVTLKSGLPGYILHSRIIAAVTSPLIYIGVIPFMLLDVFLSLFQGVCFPVYGIPKVKRSDYVIFDRGSLKYLNLLERLNCVYCSYANGLSGYLAEIAARTEQHWCPIKHARRLRAPHSRYSHFFEFGDAERYRRGVETVRNDFVDVRSLTSSWPKKDS